LVWSTEDGKIYADASGRYELVPPASSTASPHVIRWWAGEPDHPIINDLKSRPGEWALLWERAGDGELGQCDAFWACDHHKRVEVHVQRFPGLYGPDQSVSARWIPDDEWARRQGYLLAAKEARDV